MTDKPESYFTQKLLEIYPCKKPFNLKIIHSKPKGHCGFYTAAKAAIRINDGWGDTHRCLEIAIHEYAHHLHHTEFDKQEKGQKPHGREFWQIYGQLMALAKKKLDYEEKAPILPGQ